MSDAAENVVAKLSNIGKYRLIASLGQGGMAKVYLALMAGPAGFNKLLVIKALREDMMSTSEEFVAMFLDEARLAARLNHPNVVQTYEVGEAEGRYFIAMEYLEGQALRTAQRRLAPEGLPQEEEMRVLAETARGLHYAHELKGFDGEPLNVVHRDVSPQNVFLTYDGQVKLLDFGIAKTQDAEHLTKVGVIKGKVDYIAPEQIRGEKIDRRADVFALGAMMWEALAGRRFAGGPKVADVTKIHNRVTGREPKLAEVAPDTPPALIEICERALALDADERYPSAEEFANDLDAYLATTTYKPSNKTLAELISPAFEDERAKLRTLIDQQIQLVQSQGGIPLGDSTAALPRLSPSVLMRTGSGIRESSYSGATSLPDLSIMTSGTPPSQMGMPLEMEPPRKGVPKAVALSLVAAAIGVAAFLGTQEDPPPTAGGLPTATNTAVAPAIPSDEIIPNIVAPKMDTVRVHVEVKPEGAAATLDGARLPRLPFEADLAKDGKLHTLEVRAAGYEPIKQVLTFDRDQHLSLELQRQQAAPIRRRRTASRHGAPEPEPEPAPTTPEPKAKPERTPSQNVVAPGQDLIDSTTRRAPTTPKIDLDDPYQ